ncbi:asparaginase [Paremcibacter congregatus]|uniref:asparaginase n=1 Tax=Paremcibacter congregatus TaxID=2043170 RepID=UPI003A92CB5F
MARSKVRLFLLGGTITMADSAAPDSAHSSATGGVVPTVDAAALCRAVPGLADVAEVEARTDLMIASGNLTYAHALALATEINAAATAGDVDGFVVVQGTDTLEEMAFLLDCLLDIAPPVVVTGALRSAAALSADGPANILAAVTAAATGDLGRAGVMVVMNDDIHSACFVTKSHTGSPAAFTSPTMGPIGRVTEGRAALYAVPRRGAVGNIPSQKRLPRVALLSASYGDDGFLLNLLAGAGCDGLVIEAFGAGHVPEAYLASLEKLVKTGPVILASRTGSGPVFQETYGYPGAEIDLISRGLIPAGILDGRKAKILLTLLMMNKVAADGIRAAFESWTY